MKPDEKVVDALFNALFVDNMSYYRQLLEGPADGASDVFGRARDVLARLCAEDREAVFKFIELAMSDSASVILGTLDGTHFPGDLDGDFAVRYGDHDIHGNLQDLFIAQGESRRIY
ncbi:Uncharacterised protein [Bordetella ansorpii]|uniref:Uncharacterized protein n=1 Tax=Bordetella ansorpii TaxID=288768 RepID=A0A157SIA4_9BORD|nr:hypothetical protein [Bordetella ansorpii]SAI69923.1 Uncharacterised protein [Bordetella ansorpii]